MKSGYVFLLKSIMLLAILILFAGCGLSGATTDSSKSNGTGSLTAKLVWPDNGSISKAKTTAKTAAGVVTVRIVVSGTGFSTMQKDFAAGDPGGTIDEIPAGSGCTLKAQGLDSNGAVTYQGEISGITVEAGKVTDLGTVEMLLVNNPPVAHAGADQSVVAGNLVTLDGSGSSDVNGDSLTYRWSLTSGPAESYAVISDNTTVNPTFTPDLAGDYILSLIVNDGKADSVDDTVTVTVTANPLPELVIRNAQCNYPATKTITFTIFNDGFGSATAPIAYKQIFSNGASIDGVYDGTIPSSDSITLTTDSNCENITGPDSITVDPDNLIPEVDETNNTTEF